MQKSLNFHSPKVFSENSLSARRENKLQGLHHLVALSATAHLKLPAELFFNRNETFQLPDVVKQMRPPVLIVNASLSHPLD